MFRRYVSDIVNDEVVPDEARTLELLSTDPLTLAFILESSWQLRGRAPEYGSDGSWVWYAAGFGDQSDDVGAAAAAAADGGADWDHLIYAYMIENTHAFEIFHRVLWELAHGEKLGIPVDPDTYRWMRTTEELFYKDSSPFQPWSMVSRIRPDIRANRRNAYFRMFGMDLNHGGPGGAYAYEKAPSANRDFAPTLEEFLTLVWVGIENANNGIGPNPTDSEAIANLAQRLQSMLLSRRGSELDGPFLAREEFDYVSTMAWFHLTVSFNTPIVKDLRAVAPTAEERLRLVGERVGVPAHARSHSYFVLAPAISLLLTQLEAGAFNDLGGAEDLYALGAGGTANPIREMAMTVITHWSLVTGRDLKSRAVRITTRSATPAQAGAVSSSSTSVVAVQQVGNGRTPVSAGRES
jgi:hypothetical protein